MCNALLLPELKRTMETAIAKFLEVENVGFLYCLALITGCDGMLDYFCCFCFISFLPQNKALASSCIQLGRSDVVGVMTADLQQQIPDPGVRQDFVNLIQGRTK